MDVFERKQEILKLLHRDGRVYVNELSKLFGISDVTIRMDLSDLESKGLLARVHGGAVSCYKTYYNMSMQERLSVNQEQKKNISAAIVAMIKDNDVIMLNAGTTTLTTFRMIPAHLNVSIVTNSMAVALEAGANPNFTVVLLGGQVNFKYQFTYGDDAIAQLQKYHADKLILSVDGISADAGMTTYYNREVEIDRIMLSHAKTKIIAADATKLGRIAFAKISDARQVDCVVTTNDPDQAEEIAKLKKVVPSVLTV